MATQKVYYRIDSIQGNQVTVGIYDHIPMNGLRLAVKRKEGEEEIFDADISGILEKNASSASKLQTSVSLKTNLASTTAISFDGSASQDNIPVSGVLPISNGGTGSSTQNFVDLSNSQVINGVKTFGSTIEGVVDRSIKDGSGNVIANTYATKAIATSLADGLMSSTDKSKLDSIGTVFNFKGSVADTASLPGSGNTAGDAYLVQSPLGLQAWNGTSWVDIGSSALLPISDNEIDAVFA